MTGTVFCMSKVPAHSLTESWYFLISLPPCISFWKTCTISCIPVHPTSIQYCVPYAALTSLANVYPSKCLAMRVWSSDHAHRAAACMRGICPNLPEWYLMLLHRKRRLSQPPCAARNLGVLVASKNSDVDSSFLILAVSFLCHRFSSKYSQFFPDNLDFFPNIPGFFPFCS